MYRLQNDSKQYMYQITLQILMLAQYHAMYILLTFP